MTVCVCFDSNEKRLHNRSITLIGAIDAFLGCSSIEIKDKLIEQQP